MSESRGGHEDRRLQESFARIVANGTDFVSAAQFTATLTSRQLKTKPKSANIAGLQLADEAPCTSFTSTNPATPEIPQTGISFWLVPPYSNEVCTSCPARPARLC